MSDELEQVQDGPQGMGRRQFVKGSAMVGGLVWAAPAMSTFGARAFAGTPSQPEGVPDMCPRGTESGQPRGLKWEFRPEGCEASSNDQGEASTDLPSDTSASPSGGETLVCHVAEDELGNALFPNGPFDLTVRVQREGGLATDFEGITFGTEFYSNGEDGQAGSWTSFEVTNADGVIVHFVRMHTSCSQPLAIGDQFGAFRLVGGISSDDYSANA